MTAAKRITISIVIAALAGCASNRQWQDAPIADNKEQLMALGNQCYENMKSDPRVQPIVGKVAFNVNDQTVLMYSNKNKPTAKEKQAILFWDTTITECQKYWNAAYPPANQPEFNAIRSRSETANKKLVAYLYSLKISYGDYASIRKEIHDHTLKLQSEALTRVNAQIQQSNQREREIAAQESGSNYLRKIGDALINAGTPQPVQSAPATALPVNTTCTKQGVFVNCTTY
jgi:hypothetical protein